MTETKNKPPRDPRIMKHIQALAAAAEARDPKMLVDALTELRGDARLTPIQRGAIFKTIAQEQASAYQMILTGRGFGERPASA